MTNVLTSLTALIERVKTVITDPTGCWDVVASDSRDAQTLFKVYAVPMALLGALAGTVGTVLMGLASLIGIAGLVVQFVTAVITTCAAGFIAAFIATKIAAFVGGNVTLERAYSWFLHASMVGFVGSLAVVVPIIGMFVAFLASIATLYWGWMGIGKMIDVPSEKRALFYVGTIVGTFLVNVVFTILLGSVLPGSVVVPVTSTVTQ